MKRIVLFILLLCTLLGITACSRPTLPVSSKPTVSDSAKQKETVFLVDGYDMQITADSAFSEKAVNNFDLQITNGGKSYISVMGYRYIDLSTDGNPLEIYNWHNEDLFSKRDNVVKIEDDQTQWLAHSTLTHALYSAERDGIKSYYATYLVDFPEAETFAWVLVTAVPSYFEDNRSYLEGIVASLTSIA